jgi:PHP domain-containing protein
VKSTPRRRPLRLVGCVALAVGLLWSATVGAGEPGQVWRPVTTVFHVHSDASTGSDSLESLVAQARSYGIDAIILTDNFLLRYEYGLFPLRGLIRRTVTLPSIMSSGVDRYLEAIREVNRRHPEVLVLPGVEVMPHYYWTGSLFRKDLTLHDAQKNILVVGLPADTDYKRLPVAGNYASYEYGWLSVLWLSPVLLVAPAMWLLNRRVERKVRVGWTFMIVRTRLVVQGVALLIVAGLLLFNNYPFGQPPFDVYQDGNGLQPHQHLIQYVRERGGLTVWSMPEVRDFNRYGFGRLGVVTVKTDPYPDALRQTTDYTAFGALYFDTITMTDAGGVWDAVLGDYASGRRTTPVWGVGEAAFHGRGHAGKELFDVETIVWVRERTEPALLDALEKGRMYTLLRSKEYGLILNEFTLISEATGEASVSGQTLRVPASSPILVRLAVSSDDGRSRQTPVLVIRSGRLMKTGTETVPFTLTLRDTAPSVGDMSYYRLMIGTGDHRIVSNPIFIRGE